MKCKCYHADKNFFGKIGVCWGTKECEACSCEGNEEKCDFYDYVRERAKKSITNADWIRAMTDEKLAEWGATLLCCPPGPDLEELCYSQNVCENTDFARKCWIDWLRQEVNDEN